MDEDDISLWPPAYHVKAPVKYHEAAPFSALNRPSSYFDSYNLLVTVLELQRWISENLKQIFPEKELRGLSPNESVSDWYIPTVGLPILLQENLRTDPTNT